MTVNIFFAFILLYLVIPKNTLNSHIKKIEFIFDDYEERCKKLKNICKELRNKNQESTYIFGLDAFW